MAHWWFQLCVAAAARWYFVCIFSLPKIATKYNSLILILKIVNLVHLFMSPFPGCLWAVVQSLQCSTGVSVFGDLDWYGLNGRGGIRFIGMCLFSLIQGAESCKKLWDPEVWRDLWFNAKKGVKRVNYKFQ